MDNITASPIAHGRTAFVDFRPSLLARPKVGFSEDDTGWFLDYMDAVQPRTSEELLQERWVTIRRNKLLVFGVMTGATQLSNVMTHELYLDRGQERKRREVYAFVGFVSTDNLTGGAAELPRDIALFRQVYEELFTPRWREKISDSDWDKPTLTESRVVQLSPPKATEPLIRPPAGRMAIWPRSADDAVWKWGSTASASTAIALGLARVNDSQRLLLDGCTSDEVTVRIERDRQPSQPVGARVAGPPGPNYQVPKRDLRTDAARLPTEAEFRGDDSGKSNSNRQASEKKTLGIGAILVASSIVVVVLWLALGARR